MIHVLHIILCLVIINVNVSYCGYQCKCTVCLKETPSSAALAGMSRLLSLTSEKNSAVTYLDLNSKYLLALFFI